MFNDFKVFFLFFHIKQLPFTLFLLQNFSMETKVTFVHIKFLLHYKKNRRKQIANIFTTTWIVFYEKSLSSITFKKDAKSFLNIYKKLEKFSIINKI